MSDDRSYEDRVLGRIPREVLAASLLLAVPAGIALGPCVGGLFFAGGGLAALGFLSLKRWLYAAALGDRRKTAASLVGVYVLRLVLIAAIFSSIILLYKKKAIAFAAGFSVLILVLLAEALVAVARKPIWKS